MLSNPSDGFENRLNTSFVMRCSVLSHVWHMFDEHRGYLAKVREDADFTPFVYNKDELRLGEPDRRK
jgi:hypothetical protein